MIEKECKKASEAIRYALDRGASDARVTISKSTENLVSVLDGEIDRITSCADCSLSLALFVDGRFGSFSTNRLDSASLDAFIDNAIDTVRMMAPDGCRALPDLERCCRTALTGDELDLYDAEYELMTPERRKEIALSAALKVDPEGYEIASEEGEYSDSVYETVVMDSHGLKCLHRETSFDYGVEVTVEACGEKYCSYHWVSSSRLADLDIEGCGKIAMEKAAAQIGSAPTESGKYNMVIDSEVASKVVSPVLNALNAYSLHQQNSFLGGTMGKKMFPEGMTLVDNPHIKGQVCSKLFDSEGVATVSTPIVENGVVKEYFVNTYMSRKMGTAPTVEDPTRPQLLPWPVKGMTRADVLEMCGNGILVTDFNGGNSNPATGDFSYGIEGFLFENGAVVRPVSGMLVTGNFLTLWNSLLAVADDARPCMSKLIPTLAFSNVDFSG